MHLQDLILFATEQAAEHAAKPNFIATLGINWKLLLAQLVNFSIVLFILWKWVFRPVTGALESRRQKIEKSVQDAEEIETRMKSLATQEQAAMQKVRSEAAALLKTTRDTAQRAQEETAAAAKQEAEKIMSAAKVSIEAEKQQMLQEVREEIATLTVMATEKILREKLNKDKDAKIIEEILKTIG